MCLILTAYRCIPGYEIVLASNRDEFYDRPTSPADWWSDPAGIVGGRDMLGGGTWLGMSRNGRLATIANIRDQQGLVDGARSRGLLVVDFLTSREGAADYCTRVSAAEGYNGFNLLAWDGERMSVCSNRNPRTLEVVPGVFGISNGRLDSAWPKVRSGVRRLTDLVDQAPPRNPDLLRILRNNKPAPDPDLPDTGFGIEWERLLSSAFIRSKSYGTRCSTIVKITDGGRATLDEYTYRVESDKVDHRHISICAV